MNPGSRGTVNEAAHEDETRPRSATALIVLAVGAALFFAVFMALGTWQVQRLHWKLDLIERVNQRVHAPAVAAPGPERWSQITAASDEYRHVRVTGSFLHDRTAKVQAVTELGSGYWLLTPLARALAERGRSAFMLTAPPLRLPGAVGSPVTPVGTI